MRRLTVALLITPLAVAACSSPAPSPAESASAASAPSVSESASTAADAYCSSVDEFIAASRKALKDPLDADTQALSAQAKELQAQATALAGELIDDPAGVTKVQQCTEKLQDFNSGT